MGTLEIQKSIEFCNKFEQSVKEAGAISATDMKELEKIPETLPKDDPFRKQLETVLEYVSGDLELDEGDETSRVQRAFDELKTLMTGSPDLASTAFQPSFDKLARLFQNKSRHAPSSNAQINAYDLSIRVTDSQVEGTTRAKIRYGKGEKRPDQLILEAFDLEIESVQLIGKQTIALDRSQFRIIGNRLLIDLPQNFPSSFEVKIEHRSPIIDLPKKCLYVEERHVGLIKEGKRYLTFLWPDVSGAVFPSNPRLMSKVTMHLSSTNPNLEFAASGERQAHHKGQPDETFIIKLPTLPPDLAIYAIDRTAMSYTEETLSRGMRFFVYTENDPTNQFKTDLVPKVLRHMKQAFGFYEKLLGSYPYGNSLGFFEHCSSGIEQAGIVGFRMFPKPFDKVDQVRTLRRELMVAHEVSHHWFGTGVYPDPLNNGEVWLSEAPATLLSLDYFESLPDQASKQYAHTQWGEMAKELKEAIPKARFGFYTLNDVDPSVYRKYDRILPYFEGSWVLRMLRGKLDHASGAGTFSRIFKKWYQSNVGKIVTTPQFIAFLKKESGIDFNNFFKQWRELRSFPTFDYSTSQADGKIYLQIEPEKASYPDGIEIPVLLTHPNGAKVIKTLTPNQPLQLDFIPHNYEWDPYQTVLAEVKKKS